MGATTRMPLLRVVLKDGAEFDPGGDDAAALFPFKEHSKPRVICVAHLLELRRQTPQQWQTETVLVTAGEAAVIADAHGIEAPDVPQEPAQLAAPGHGVVLNDQTLLLVEGHRRYVGRAFAGKEYMLLHVCRRPLWRRALVDVPATRRLRQQRPFP